MVSWFVWFLFTCREQSKTHSIAALTRAIVIRRNSGIKIPLTNHKVIPISTLYYYQLISYDQMLM